MTRPLCQCCQRRLATHKGATFKRSPGQKVAIPAAILWSCATCPKVKRYGGRRVRWTLFNWGFAMSFTPALTAAGVAARNDARDADPPGGS